jgi:transposase
VMAVRVTGHRCQRVCCPGCGATRTGLLPASVAVSAFGPRLQAAVVTLSVRNRISRRDVVELCEQLFSSRISTGTVDAILQRALWGVFTDRHAVLKIEPDRHEDRAKELLGTSAAIVTSDRWWAYGHLPIKRRQVCWSHLQRDFAFHAEGLGVEKQLGEHGLRI